MPSSLSRISTPGGQPPKRVWVITPIEEHIALVSRDPAIHLGVEDESRVSEVGVDDQRIDLFEQPPSFLFPVEEISQSSGVVEQPAQ
jgi:hypothetical protein